MILNYTNNIQENHLNDDNEINNEKIQNKLLKRRSRSGKLGISAMKFEDRLEHYASKKQENSTNIAMSIMADEKKNCTFTPKVNGRPRRTLKDFIQDQNRTQQKKSKKLNDLKSLLIMNEAMQNSSNCLKKNSLKSKSLKKIFSKEKQSPIKSRNLGKSNGMGYTMTTENKTINEENRNQKTKLTKEDAYLKSKLMKELEVLFNIYNPHKRPIDFTSFCTLKN